MCVEGFVGVAVAGQGHRRPGAVGGALHAGPEPDPQVVEIVRGDRPEVELPGGGVRHDVGRGAAVGDDPVHLLAVPKMLAHQPHRRVAEHQPVERVASELGRGAGVRRLAVEDDTPLLDRERARRVVVVRRRVDHHRGVDALERTRVDQVGLAATDLLGRRAEHREPEPALDGQGAECGTGAQGGGRDHVVPAGVADLGQGVVLGADHQVRSGRADPGSERRGEAVRRRLDLEAVPAEEVDAPLGGSVLVVGELRVRRDGVGDAEDLVGDRTDPAADELHVRGGRGPVGGCHGPSILSHSSTSRCRSGAPRSAKPRWAAAYSALPSGVSIAHRLEAEVGEVVRRRPHVEHPDVAGQLEAVGDQVGGDHRRQAERVLVEVHARVEAARLLVVGTVVAAGGQQVEPARRLGEEPVGVEVGARDPVRLDHAVGAVGAEPQRPVGVAGLVLGQPVDHRPLVHPEAAEVGRPGRGGGEQRVQRLEQRALGDDVLRRDRHCSGGRARRDLVTPQTGVIGRVDQPHAVPRMPAPQLGRPVRVVGEQEVVHRVLGVALAAGQVRLDEGIDARRVGVRALPPVGSLQHLHGAQG